MLGTSTGGYNWLEQLLPHDPLAKTCSGGQRSQDQVTQRICIARLAYNAGTWGVPESGLDKLDTFHRRQLRHLGVFYPEVISNEDLYSRCKARPISEMVQK